MRVPWEDIFGHRIPSLHGVLLNATTGAQLAKIFGILFSLGGAPFLILGLVFFFKARSFESNAIAVRGTVVEMVEEKKTEEHGINEGTTQTYYYPVFAFADEKGTMHRVKSSIGTGSAPARVGDAVDLRYLPGDAESAQMADSSGMWIFAGVFGFFGIFFDSIGLMMLIVVPRLIRKSEKAAAAAATNP